MTRAASPGNAVFFLDRPQLTALQLCWDSRQKDKAFQSMIYPRLALANGSSQHRYQTAKHFYCMNWPSLQ